MFSHSRYNLFFSFWRKYRQLLLLIITFGLALLSLICAIIMQYGFWFFEARDQTNINPATLSVISSSTATFNNDTALLATPLSYLRLKIPKIGVDMPIIVGEKNEKKALARGAWLIPGTAIPGTKNNYNNTVISGHRYTYITGSKTFFHLDELTAGDQIFIVGDKPSSTLMYVVQDKKIVMPNEVHILAPTVQPTLTLFTCHPAFSTKQRLVIIASLVH